MRVLAALLAIVAIQVSAADSEFPESNIWQIQSLSMASLKKIKTGSAKYIPEKGMKFVYTELKVKNISKDINVFRVYRVLLKSNYNGKEAQYPIAVFFPPDYTLARKVIKPGKSEKISVAFMIPKEINAVELYVYKVGSYKYDFKKK